MISFLVDESTPDEAVANPLCGCTKCLGSVSGSQVVAEARAVVFRERLVISDDFAVLVLDLVFCIWPRDHVMVPSRASPGSRAPFHSVPRYSPWSVAARQLQQLTPR